MGEKGAVMIQVIVDPMTQALRRSAWTRALRSGSYRQGVKSLCRMGGRYCYWCCLGVAINVAREGGLEIPERFERWSSSVLYGVTREPGSGSTSWMPEPVVDWYGLNDDVGSFQLRSGRLTSLARLNDRGVSFSRIAGVIDRAPSGFLALGSRLSA
jgi:hypothetical protein